MQRMCPSLSTTVTGPHFIQPREMVRVWWIIFFPDILDKTGYWDINSFEETAPPLIHTPKTTSFPENLNQEIFRSIVKVSSYMPIRVDGFPRARKHGAGLILDSKNGIVVVGRGIVPFAIGDVWVTVAESVIVPAKVIYIHPTQNISFIQYDPALLGETPTMSANLVNASTLKPGDRVKFFALNHTFQPVSLETSVTDISPVTIPISGSPRLRPLNFGTFS